MISGEKLTLDILKKELPKAERALNLAKAKEDEYMNVGSTIINLRKEAAELINGKPVNQATLDKLDELVRREKRAIKLLDQDLVKLMDKTFEAERRFNGIREQISMLEFRISLRGGR